MSAVRKDSVRLAGLLQFVETLDATTRFVMTALKREIAVMNAKTSFVLNARIMKSISVFAAIVTTVVIAARLGLIVKHVVKEAAVSGASRVQAERRCACASCLLR